MRFQSILLGGTMLLLNGAHGGTSLFAAGTNPPPTASKGTRGQSAITRPPEWALKLDQPGLPNFHQVTTNLFRGAQPTARGMANLKAMGIKTVINLRAFHSDKDKLASGDLKPARFHMQPWHPEDEDVIRFLKIATDTNNLPVFVHCQHGADRTGVMCAMYRIAVCSWTKEEAIKEMKEGGFGFHRIWRNLVKYVERADIGDLKRGAGMPVK